MAVSDASGRKVSVIVPTYNRAKFLRVCLRSVLAQSYADLELIVIDDGSTDDTAALLNELARSDPRVKVFHQNRKGAQVARNLGLAECKGDLVSFLDDDDLWHPNKLEHQVFALHAEVDGVICQTVWFREWPGDHNFIFNSFDDRDFLARFLRLDVVWQTAAPIWRKSFLSQVGKWDERLTSGQDLDFHTRCLCYQPKLKVLQEVLNFFREHEGVRITKDRKEQHPGNTLIAMRNAYELMKARGILTPERGEALANTLMRQSRTLAFYGERKLCDESMRIALDVHPSAAVRKAIRRYLWPMNRMILQARRLKSAARALRRASQVTMQKLGHEEPRITWWQTQGYTDEAAIASWKSDLKVLEI